MAFIGEHFVQLVVGVISVFVIVLLTISVQDALHSSKKE